MKRVGKICLTLLILVFLGLFAVFFINRHVSFITKDKIQTSITEIRTETPPRAAIVFGARVWENGEPSEALYDRIVTAVELYRAGRVKKILMSGDNQFENYDEPTAMKAAAIRLGVSESDIILDFAGRRTYDTCRRAKEIFGVERAILVTQQFHQPRAVYLCSNLGVDSIGITADRRVYENKNTWAFREFFATARAWFEINFFSFAPVIGGEKESIRE